MNATITSNGGDALMETVHLPSKPGKMDVKMEMMMMMSYIYIYDPHTDPLSLLACGLCLS